MTQVRAPPATCLGDIIMRALRHKLVVGLDLTRGWLVSNGKKRNTKAWDMCCILKIRSMDTQMLNKLGVG